MTEEASPEISQETSQDGKLHVLYLNHSGQMSGGEQSLRSLLWQFRRAGSEVEPALALPGSGPFADTMREEAWNVTFAPLRRLQRPQNLVSGMSALFHILRTAPFITRLARQSGAQLIHSNSTTAHLVGGLAAERTGMPAIWHARDLVSLARIAPALAQRANWVIAISDCVAERLQEDGVPPEKIRVIHNGLDPDVWYPREDDKTRCPLRESISADSHAFLFGCVGQLVPWKNHVKFIEAAAKLAQDEKCAHARFVIMGGDLWSEQHDYVVELRELIKQHELQARFNFIPHQADNVAAFSALDCVVLAAHEEPFGRVLIEGMALRKPVIGYDLNGPQEIITHEKDGLLAAPDDEDSLANAMRRVLLEEDLRRELGEEARKTVIERFHIADNAQSVLDLYREILH